MSVEELRAAINQVQRRKVAFARPDVSFAPVWDGLDSPQKQAVVASMTKRAKPTAEELAAQLQARILAKAQQARNADWMRTGIGGLLGAGGGAALLGMLRSKRPRDPEEDQQERGHGIRDQALLGALLGGTAGAGIGHYGGSALQSTLKRMTTSSAGEQARQKINQDLERLSTYLQREGPPSIGGFGVGTLGGFGGGVAKAWKKLPWLPKKLLGRLPAIPVEEARSAVEARVKDQRAIPPTPASQAWFEEELAKSHGKAPPAPPPSAPAASPLYGPNNKPLPPPAAPAPRAPSPAEVMASRARISRYLSNMGKIRHAGWWALPFATGTAGHYLVDKPLDRLSKRWFGPPPEIAE